MLAAKQYEQDRSIAERRPSGQRDDRRAALHRWAEAELDRDTTVRPMNRIARSTAMAVIVLAAFFDSGGLNAGTPLAIASTPVSATLPPAKALSRSSTPTALVPSGTASGSAAIGAASPPRIRTAPIATIARARPDEQVGRDREDVAGLAQAAQVGDRDQRDRDEGDLDPQVIGGRNHRLDLGDRRCRGDGDRHDVVDQQGRRRDQPEDRRQVGPGDDVRASPVGIGTADLPIRDGHHRQEDRDRDGRPRPTAAGRLRRPGPGPAGSPRWHRPTS